MSEGRPTRSPTGELHDGPEQSPRALSRTFLGFTDSAYSWAMGLRSKIGISRSQRRWWFGIQPMRLELDGVIVGKLLGGGTMTIDVNPGEHVLRAKFRVVVWSDRLTFSVAEGEERLFICENDRAGYPQIHLKGEL